MEVHRVGIGVLLRAAVLLTLLQGALFAQIEILPGNAARGAALFESRGCVSCHAFNGKGGTRAPDLAQRSSRAYTPDLLAAVIWNHSPSMWDEAKATSRSIPRLDSGEVADLFAHFYSLLYFNSAGDATRGKDLFVQKQCSRCHEPSATRAGLQSGPPISEWQRVRDPMSWAERMWNHSGEMSRRMSAAGIAWPALSSQNLVDLMTHVQKTTKTLASEFQPGNPEAGRSTFERSCESCHSFGSSLPGRVDLSARRGAPRTLAAYAASMWNHAPLMRQRSVTPAVLASGEMANLVAYLFAQRHFSEAGDPSAGQRVYREKRCGTCHDQRRADLNVPELSQSTERFSAVTMTSAIWRHGPSMLEMMKKEGISWPRFTGSEMTNLIAYLNRRLVPRIAR